MVRFQIPTLISFVLENYYHLRVFDFIDQKLFKNDISVIFDRFSSNKCLALTKYLLNAKLLVFGKLLADGKFLADSKLLVDDKHLVDTKHLASIKMLADLTYLPDLTIDEKLDSVIFLLRATRLPALHLNP